MSVGEGRQFFTFIDGVLTEVFTTKSASYHLQYSVRTLQQWIDEGKLIAINVDNRNWIPKTEIDRIKARDK